MNDYRAYVENDYNSIYHFGIKGQRWGIRRYQNEDGTLTQEGRKRYGKLYDQMKRQGKSNAEISKEIQKREKIRKAAKIGLGIAGAAAIGYGAYRGARYLKKRNIAKQLREAASKKIQSDDIDNIVRTHENALIKAQMMRRETAGKTPEILKAERQRIFDRSNYEANMLKLDLLAAERRRQISEIEAKAGKDIVQELLKSNDALLNNWRAKRNW